VSLLWHNLLAHPYGKRVLCIQPTWLGGSAARAFDTRPKGPRFNFQPMHCQVTTLGSCLHLPDRIISASGLVVSVDSYNFQVVIRFALPVTCKTTGIADDLYHAFVPWNLTIRTTARELRAGRAAYYWLPSRQ